LLVLGRGFKLATAEELALKLTETSYVMARAWSAADFLHGPIAIAEDRFPLILVESPGPTLADTRQLAARLHSSGCQVRQLADGTDRLPDATSSILFNSRLPEAPVPPSPPAADQPVADPVALL